jgi:hypothetical protein
MDPSVFYEARTRRTCWGLLFQTLAEKLTGLTAGVVLTLRQSVQHIEDKYGLNANRLDLNPQNPYEPTKRGTSYKSGGAP